MGAQRSVAEALATVRRIRRALRDVETLREAVDLGLATPDELRQLGFLLTQDDLVHGFRLPAATGEIAQEARLRVLSQIAGNVRNLVAIHRDAADDPALRTFLRASALTILDTVSKVVGAGLAAPYDIASILTGGRVDFPQEASRAIKFGVETALGLSPRARGIGLAPGEPRMGPETPEELARERLAETTGLGTVGSFERMAANVASFAAVLYGTGGAGMAGRMPAFLQRTLPLGRPAAGVTGASLVAGLAGFGLADDDDLVERFSTALAAVGGTMALGTALLGRPVGEVTRVVGALQRSKAFGAPGTLPALRRLGASLSIAPRFTLGRMTMAGGVGAGFVTSELLSAGVPPVEALLGGLKAGVEFVGWDAAFTRLGGAARFLDAQSRMASTAARIALALGVPAASAGFGALAAMAVEGDPVTAGAVLGGAGGAVGAGALLRGARMSATAERVAARLATLRAPYLGQIAPRPEDIVRIRRVVGAQLRGILDEEDVLALMSGRFDQVSAEGLRRTSSYITRVAWREAVRRETSLVRTPGA